MQTQMGENFLLISLAILSLGCVILLWRLMADDFRKDE